MRRAAKIDANQKGIVEQLRKLGVSVAVTSQLGKGFPDIAVGFGGYTILMEIKDGSRPPSERRLTDDEQKFFSKWKGAAVVVNDLQEAIDAINETIKKNEKKQ